ncbi:unnamed protein product [Rotaria sp. Silwood2]|nr:unnamed protein product [Rotaria sp. Silwood2]
MGATRITDQYLLYCKEMCSDFEPLGKSSLFTILDACKASTRKSLQGIDYFAAEAGEAFDGLRKKIEDKVALCSDSDRLIENLKRARFYLKSDYKVHVARSSNIADHCCVYALSDPVGRNLAQNCNNDHQLGESIRTVNYTKGEMINRSLLDISEFIYIFTENILNHMLIIIILLKH